MSEARLRSQLLIFLLSAAAASLTAQAPDTAPATAPPDTATATAAVQPRTVLIGMTEDQVMAILGRPASVVEAGSKKVYSYRLLKVTFLDGKVLEIRDAARTDSVDDEVLRDRVSIPVLPIEIGFGAAAIALISFMLGRRERRPSTVSSTVSSGKFPAQQAQPAWHTQSSRNVAQPLRNAEPPSDFLDRLRDLEMLRYLGVLTSEEFEEEKEKLGSPY